MSEVFVSSANWFLRESTLYPSIIQTNTPNDTANLEVRSRNRGKTRALASAALGLSAQEQGCTECYTLIGTTHAYMEKFMFSPIWRIAA